VARAAAENLPDKPELERRSPDHGPERDLRARMAELPTAHPSAADYVREQPAARERPGRDSARPTELADYAAADDVDLAPDRRTHILDGDDTGGGHRYGTGTPDKTEFPAAWNDDRIIDAILTVARNPDREPERQYWNDRWQVRGQHQGVEIVAIVQSDGAIWTAWPREESPGVVRNPLEDS
jgi:Bacterial EndoU nuclease